MKCTPEKKPSKEGWKCGPAEVSNANDVNGDGKFDNDDLIYVLRSIADPVGVNPPDPTTADLNADGKVDFDDANEMLLALVAANGADSVKPLTPDYDQTHNFNWDQAPLSLSSVRISHAKQSLPPFLDFVNRQAKKCGQMASGAYEKGTGPDPTIVWDDGYPFNASAKATASDHWNWARYTTLVTGAEALGRLPDGTRAYRRYRDESGADLQVDYEKAVREDAEIRRQVDNEVQAVMTAAKELHDGKEASFKFHSTDARLVNSATENWQKAVGGHRIWSTGEVTYDAGSCQLMVEFMIKVEDFYNFNMGQVDLATGLPDNDNGRFEVLGWAKSFFSRGKITRSETIALQCCKDSDCGDETQFDCECNLCTTQCPTQQRSGGQGFTSFTVDLKKTQGVFTVSYQMYTVPDELTISYEGAVVFGTGGLVSGARTLQVSYGSATSTSTVVTVEVNAPRSGTAWTVSVSCPP